MRLDVARFLTDLSGRYARPYFEAVHDLFVATVRGNASAAADARQLIGEVTAATMGAAEVLGAALVLRVAAGVHADARLGRAREMLLRFRDEPVQMVIPRVTLSEALDDMVERVPVTLRAAAERTAQRIAQIYGQGRAVAFVRAAEESVTAQAQQYLQRAFREGLGENEAGRGLALTVERVRVDSEVWSESYARMVFRTNVNTAVTAGRFRQVRDPEVRTVIPAFRFDTMEDVDVRPNHAPADGRIWKVDNPVWNRLAPPLGYNCRCQVAMVSYPSLVAMGRVGAGGQVMEDSVPPDAYPDPGFRHGGRPDLFLAAAV